LGGGTREEKIVWPGDWGREKGDKGREKGEREGRENGERNLVFLVLIRGRVSGPLFLVPYILNKTSKFQQNQI
jgi:hypothetical protein